jgi:hypothetical protein
LLKNLQQGDSEQLTSELMIKDEPVEDEQDMQGE